MIQAVDGIQPLVSLCEDELCSHSFFRNITTMDCYLTSINYSAIIAKLWLVSLVQHFPVILIYVIFVMDVLYIRQVVFVKLEVTWMGANRRTVKKQNKQQQSSPPFLRAKVHQPRAAGILSHLVEQKQASSVDDWHLQKCQELLTGWTIDDWKLKEWRAVRTGCGKRKTKEQPHITVTKEGLLCVFRNILSHHDAL